MLSQLFSQDGVFDPLQSLFDKLMDRKNFKLKVRLRNKDAPCRMKPPDFEEHLTFRLALF